VANLPRSKNARSDSINHHKGHEAHEELKFNSVFLRDLRGWLGAFDPRGNNGKSNCHCGVSGEALHKN
jgi:hypothetical protein